MLRDIEGVQILACGTSYYAGLTARYWIEAITGLPCSVEIASEYRYRTAVANPKHLVVTISQSGETLDTMEALKYAKSLGHDKTLSICNVPESAIPRASRLVFYTRAGAEIGVASTKAFTTQLVALFTLAATLAKLRGTLSDDTGSRLHRSAAPPAGQRAARAQPRAADRGLGRAFRAEASTRCSSAAACTTRSRWKARSSSRKSPTSTPRRIRPASSSTARWRWSTPTCRWW